MSYKILDTKTEKQIRTVYYKISLNQQAYHDIGSVRTGKACYYKIQTFLATVFSQSDVRSNLSYLSTYQQRQHSFVIFLPECNGKSEHSRREKSAQSKFHTQRNKTQRRMVDEGINYCCKKRIPTSKDRHRHFSKLVNL